MPKQGKRALYHLAALLEALEQSQGGGAVAEAEVGMGDHAAFHSDQGALDQAQGTLGDGAEGGRASKPSSSLAPSPGFQPAG